jgi:[acyl-carrier-protein] S-malonyltransferase
MEAAFVFPGQGSQSLGMMQGYSDFPVVRDTFAAASEVLRQDLWRLVNEGPAQDLNQTVNTQPIMLVAGVAVFRAWRANGGPLPIIMAGHSLAEYAALVCAEAMQLADAVALVRLRSQAMQDAVPSAEGAIAAVLGLDDEAVIEACREAAQDDVVEPANFNTPGQLVISGHKRAVDRAIEIAKAKGAKRAVILPMSIPAHCSLMRPAAQTLEPALARITISAPKIAVVQNADVKSNADPAAIRDALVRQLSGPVRWSQTIRALAQAGAKAIVECGPGKVLVGFNRRIDDSLRSYALADGAAIVATKAALASGS